MILTKSEFQKEFGFKNPSSVSNLLKAKSIVVRSDGLIDLDDKKNKAWVKKRRKKLNEDKTSEPKVKEKPIQQKLEIDTQKGNLQSDILNQKFIEAQKKNALLDLKLSKENKDVIDSEVLKKIINSVFGALFKQFADFGINNSEEIINLVLNNENPKELLTEFITEKILTSLQSALDISEQQCNKYYDK